MKDAIGNDIIIGQKYGYSMSRNGSIEVVVGTAKKINKLKITLDNIKTKRGFYGRIDEDFEVQKNSRSVYGCSLFPIIPEQLMKLMIL